MNSQESSTIPFGTVTVIPLLLLAALGLLFGRQGAPRTITAETVASSDDDAPGDELEFPSHGGVWATPSSRWEDPFKDISKARTALSSLRPSDARSSKGYHEVFRRKLQDRRDDRPAMLVVAMMTRSGWAQQRNRVNYRHTTEAAFSAQGFNLSVPDRMSYVLAPKITVDLAGVDTEHSFVVPIKLYRHADGTTAVMLWVKEDCLGGRPLDALRQILVKLFPSEPDPDPNATAISPVSSSQTLAQVAIDWALTQTVRIFRNSGLIVAAKPSAQLLRDNAALAILGPTNSDTLKEIIDECRVEDASPTDGTSDSLFEFYNWEGGSSIYSFAATVDPAEMGHDGKRYLLSGLNGEQQRTQCLAVRHFIGTNRQLVEELGKELSRRGLIPVDAALQRHVVLFTAQAELYTQSLNQLIADQLSPEGRHKLVTIPFLTGLQQNPHDGIQLQGSGNSEPTDVTDYFARTLGQMAAGYGGVDVTTNQVGLVGILAADKDDTVRILRAARSTFPNAGYFVFDRDTLLEQESGRWTTRNLLVAAHYSLRVDGSYLPRAPTFRNSYQTSAYVAANIGLLSFRDGKFNDETFLSPDGRQDLFDLWGRYPDPAGRQLSDLEPVIIEMGLTGDEIYSAAGPSVGVAVHQPVENSRRFANPRTIIVIIALMALAVATVYASRPYSSTITAWLKNIRASISSSRRMAGKLNRILAGDGGTLEKLGRTVSASLLINSILFGILLLVIITYEDIRQGGERFSWGTGVSIWPSAIIFASVTIAALSGVRGSLARGPTIACQNFRLPALRKIADRPSDRDASRYRVFFLTALLLCVPAFFAVYTGDFGTPPARSLVGRWTVWIAQIAACIAVFFCVAVVAVQTLATRNLLGELGDVLVARLRVGAGQESYGTLRDAVADATSLLHWMEQSTSRASQRLLLPSACIFAFAIARLPVWDGWPVNLFLFATLLTPFVFALVSALALRSRARQMRADLIREIDALISTGRRTASNVVLPDASVEVAGRFRPGTTPAAEGPRGESTDYDVDAKLNWLRGLLTGSTQGAFSSPFRDPLVGSVLLVASAFLTEAANDFVNQMVLFIE